MDAAQWDTQLNDASDVGGHFTRDEHYVMVEVNATDNTILKQHKLVREDSAICYFATVSPDAQYFYSACGMEHERTRGANMEHYRRGIYSISQFHVSDTYNATYETDTSSDGIVDLKRTTVDGVRNLKMEPESITMDGPGGIRYVDIDSTHHSILHLNRQTKSTLVGANLVNMGRRDYHADNQDEVHEFSSNIVIGTDSGNIRGGLQRSIIIGNAIANINPNVVHEYDDHELHECMDTDGDLTDQLGNSCEDYNVSMCGQYDDDEYEYEYNWRIQNFQSGRMCCVCGGGNEISDHRNRRLTSFSPSS